MAATVRPSSQHVCRTTARRRFAAIRHLGVFRAQRGLTLVELLVAMVIMGFVLALVSEAVFQVSQLTRATQAATASLTSRWSAGWSAGPMLANLVAPPEAPERKSFEGSPNALSGYTTLPIDAADTGIRPFNLRLQAIGDGALQTEMRATTGAPGRQAGEPAAIARFDGRAEFAYVDENGAISDTWPPLSVGASVQPADLPSAVIVRRPFADELLMWYPFPGETRKPVVQTLPFQGGQP